MKILSNKRYEDMKDQIKQGEYAYADFQRKKKDFENKIDELEKNNKDLIHKTTELISEKHELSLQKEIIQDNYDSLQNALDETTEKLRSATGRIGGLQKYNNKLKKLLEDAEEKINNFKERCKSEHVPLTINQYDKRFKPVNKTKRNK